MTRAQIREEYIKQLKLVDFLPTPAGYGKPKLTTQEIVDSIYKFQERRKDLGKDRKTKDRIRKYARINNG